MMFKTKISGIVLTMLCSLFLFGMVNNSNAFEITSMSIENGASGCYVSLTADEDIKYIDWYVKQTYPLPEGEEEDFEWVHTSQHGAGTRSVYVNIGYLEGHIKIAEYKVKAIAFFIEPNWDDAVDTVNAYKAIVYSDEVLGVHGTAYLWSQYYDGSHITIDCSTFAYNPTDRSYSAFSKFKHTVLLNGNLFQEKPDERTTPSKPLKKNGGAYNESDTLSEPVGRIEAGQTYNSEAYIRLTVGGVSDAWHILHSEDFTDKDNREDD